MSKVREQDPEGFSEFWSVWQPHMRRTDGRLDARDGYRKHILAGADPQEIIDGAKWFIRDWMNLPAEKREYIPLAKTWLNKGTYLDLCDKERDFQRRSAEIASRPSNITTFPKGQTAFLRQQKQG